MPVIAYLKWKDPLKAENRKVDLKAHKTKTQTEWDFPR